MVRGVPFAKGDPRIYKGGRGITRFNIPSLLKKIGEERLPPALRGKVPEFVRESKDMLEALMRTTYSHALHGESWAVQFIAERTEGKIKDKLEVEARTVPPIVVRLPTRAELEGLKDGPSSAPSPA